MIYHSGQNTKEQAVIIPVRDCEVFIFMETILTGTIVVCTKEGKKLYQKENSTYEDISFARYFSTFPSPPQPDIRMCGAVLAWRLT